MAPLISILHPSRGRPQRSIDAINKWINLAFSPVELIISLDEDDPHLAEYDRLYGNHWLLDPIRNANRKIIVNKNRSAVDAINRAAESATGTIFIVVSDDTDCPSAWDSQIHKAVESRSDFVLAVNDGIQPWFITAPILDRTYYNRFGYVYLPDYTHMFCDTHFTHVAELTGRIIRRMDMSFPHLHYCKGKSKKDSINERADLSWKQGEELYLKHFRDCFGLQGVNPWDIPDENHKNWLRAKLR